MTSDTGPDYGVYPITMAHPAFEASKPIPVPGSQIYGRNGEMTRQDYRGTPERYPPVTASGPEEEEYYMAQGYQRAGQIEAQGRLRPGLLRQRERARAADGVGGGGRAELRRDHPGGARVHRIGI